MPGERRGARAAGTVGALLAAVPFALAAVWGAGHTTHVVDLVGGAAWLVSPTRALISLVDGPSAQVAVTLRLPVADPTTSVVQGRGAAYVVRAGTLTRVDAATWTVGRAVAFGGAGTDLTVLPGTPADGDAPHLWVLDGRTVRTVDARSLEVRATADLRLADQVRAVVDADGDLWAADAEQAVRVVLRHGGLEVTPVGTGGDVVLVQGRAVLVDVARGTVRPLDASRAASCERARSRQPGARVVGSATSPEVFTAAEGVLRVAATDGATCGTVAPVGGPDADLSALAQVGRYVVAPDRTTGVTTVVDHRTREVQTFALTDPGHRVELVVDGSTVFWNDLDGHGSGLLQLTGGTWRSTTVDKFDPATGAGAQVARTGADASTGGRGAPASFRVATLTPDRTLYAPGAPALLTADVTGERTDDEVWWWRFENLVTGAVEDLGTGPPGAPLSIAALPDVGEYAVTLAVVRDGRTATATASLRVVVWCALTVASDVVDLAADPTLEVTVDPACPVRQQITVGAEPWLEVTAAGDFTPGAPGVLTLRAVGEPPGAGRVAGALRLEVAGQPGSQVRVDVVAAP